MWYSILTIKMPRPLARDTPADDGDISFLMGVFTQNKTIEDANI
jgi:hypothetical protein